MRSGSSWPTAPRAVAIRRACARRSATLKPSTTRLDLGSAVQAAGEVLSTEALPGEIVVITDLQATALGGASTRAPLTIARPEGEVPRNIGVAGLVAGSQPWSTDGGQVQVMVTGDSAAQAPLQLTAGDRPARQALATVGGAVQVAVPAAPAGWYALRATIQPDELRLDDQRVLGLRMAPLARASCTPAGRFAEAACDVLRSNGRLLAGDDVDARWLRIGRLGDPAAGGSRVARRGQPRTRAPRRHLALR